MPYLFDNLPLDMIHYEIFPYLDYNSRVTANLMLPLQDRARIPLNQHTAIHVAMYIGVARLGAYLKAVDKSVSSHARNRNVLKMYREFPKYYFMFQYHQNLRTVCLEKTREFSNPANTDYEGRSKHFKTTLIALCNKMLEDVEQKYPFIENIYIEKHDEWSAIRNSRHVIVDNSEQVNEYLERQRILQEHDEANDYYSSDED